MKLVPSTPSLVARRSMSTRSTKEKEKAIDPNLEEDKLAQSQLQKEVGRGDSNKERDSNNDKDVIVISNSRGEQSYCVLV